MENDKLFDFAKEAKTFGEKAFFSDKSFLDASQYYYYAAEAFDKLDMPEFAADCYKMSFLSNIQSIDLLKDFPQEKYLGDMEKLLIKIKRYDLLENNYHKIETYLKNYGYLDLSTKYYSRKMTYKKKLLFINKKYILWFLYTFWQQSSNYGESFSRWLLFILIFSFIYALSILPAPNKSMETIAIYGLNYSFNSFWDYYIFSLITLAPWDWKFITPLNFYGKLLLLFKLLLGYIIFGLFLNLISRKFIKK